MKSLSLRLVTEEEKNQKDTPADLLFFFFSFGLISPYAEIT